MDPSNRVRHRACAFCGSTHITNADDSRVLCSPACVAPILSTVRLHAPLLPTRRAGMYAQNSCEWANHFQRQSFQCDNYSGAAGLRGALSVGLFLSLLYMPLGIPSLCLPATCLGNLLSDVILQTCSMTTRHKVHLRVWRLMPAVNGSFPAGAAAAARDVDHSHMLVALQVPARRTHISGSRVNSSGDGQKKPFTLKICIRP